MTDKETIERLQKQNDLQLAKLETERARVRAAEAEAARYKAEKWQAWLVVQTLLRQLNNKTDAKTSSLIRRVFGE